MNQVSATGAYCFYDNKPEVIYAYTTDKTDDLILINIIPNSRNFLFHIKGIKRMRL